MIICPDCGKKVPKARFCKNCGAYTAGIEDMSDVCPQCGADIEEDSGFCPACGYNLNPDNQSKNKSVFVAVILSVFIPGLAQIYLGLNTKGVILLIAYIVSVILILFTIGILLCVIIWIWALIDAVQSVNALNRGDEVKDKLF